MTEKTEGKGVKRSFHIPQDHIWIDELIEVVAEVKGTTPSQWVYSVVYRKLQDAGLLDDKGGKVQAKVNELIAALPPGALEKRGKKNVNRSKKSP